MLKVLAIVDKELTAIDRLATGAGRHHTNLDYKVIAVHPKRPSAEQLELFEREAVDADLIDWQYFKSAEMLRNKYPWLQSKKQILTHHNPYSIKESDWSNYDLVIANSKQIYDDLSEITSAPLEYVGNTIDTGFWEYNQDWQPNNNVIMVANRIESKKGILPVAKACKELNLNFNLVGSISDPSYFAEIMQVGNVIFHEKISDQALLDLYHKSTIYVFNSVDNFESSGQPLLEAMLTGVPVLTRRIGIVPELDNGENMIVRDSIPDDVEQIKVTLLEMLMDRKKLEQMRDKAWNTAKVRSHERRAYQYQKLYRQVLFPNSLPVSVVMPIYDKPDVIRKCLDAIARQTYDNVELIVCDDSLESSNFEIVRDFATYVNFPVRYLRTAKVVADSEYPNGHKDYGLARARNVGTIEATGEIMVYIDQRQVPEENAIHELMKYAKPRYWVFGNKGSGKKEFVENFSCVYRRDVIMAGMFNERCDKYGAMSEELRKRIRYQGIKTEYVASAKATPTGKSSNRNRKRNEIIASKNMCWKMFDSFGE